MIVTSPIFSPAESSKGVGSSLARWFEEAGVLCVPATHFPPLGKLLREAGEIIEGVARFRTFEGAEGVQFLVGGTGRFSVDANGLTIRYELVPGCSLEDADHILGGPVFGMALQLAGTPILHASAVVMDGRAVAFSAISGMGKSTLCASFGRAGFPLIADDMLLLAEDGLDVRVKAYLPKLKLWEDSVSALGEDPADFPSVLSWIDKKRVLVRDRWGREAVGSFPLSSIYLLRPSSDACSPISIRPLSTRAATVPLLAAAYMPETLSGGRSVGALDAAARIAENVPVRVISYYRSFENLPAIRDAILCDVEVTSAGI